MTRILFVTPFSDLDHGGASDRSRGIEAALSRHGTVSKQILPIVKRPWANRRRPYWYFRPTKKWTDDFRARAADHDVVVATLLPTAFAVSGLIPDGKPFIYDAHNDETSLAAHYAGRRFREQIAVIETRTIASATVTWAAGDRDAQTLGARHPGASLRNLPNGVSSLEALTDSTRSHAQQPAIFTLGSWGYQPNSDGLSACLEVDLGFAATVNVFGELTPALRRRMAEANRRDTGLHWVEQGFEPDWQKLRDRGGRAAFVGVWSGSGTKLRTVQLAARAVPFVCTTEAASGLPNSIVQQLAIEDTPRALLAAAVARTWSSAETATLRNTVLSELSWDRLVSRAIGSDPQLWSV